jgi:hypothetical protein
VRFSVISPDLLQLAHDIAVAHDQLERENHRALEGAGEPLLDAVRDAAPVRTGELKASGRVGKAQAGTGLVEFTAKHALPVEFSHRIKKLGPPPRFAFRTLDQPAVQEQMVKAWDEVVGPIAELEG